MARMSLDTAIRLSAEVKGGANITKVQRSLQDLAKGSQTTARDMNALRTATAHYARASEGSIAGIRNSIVAFRGLQEQAKIGSREFTRYGAEVQRLERNLRGLEGTARKANPALSGLGAAAGRLLAAYAGIETVRFVFGNTAELEAQTRSLEVLTGSADRAKQIVQELQQLGAVTPFTSTELIDTAKRLQAFGVETEKVVDITRRLADVSGATGAELAGLATAYGQVQAKGRLQGEELLQFQERGVALQQVLRDEYGLSGAEFQKALEGGKISAEAVEFALRKLTDSGGKYANGAIAQSDTLNGRLSTLQDSIQVLAQTVGRKLEPEFKKVLNVAISLTGQIQQMVSLMDNLGGQRRELDWQREADLATDRFAKQAGWNPLVEQGKRYEFRQLYMAQKRADYDLSQQGARATNAAPPSTAPPPLSGGGGGSDKNSNPMAELLRRIRSGEGSYTSINRGRAGDTPGGMPGLTNMSVGQVMEMQKAGRAFAVGAYQFIPKTLEGAVKRLGIDSGERFSPGLQDKLAQELILGGTKRPALSAYLTGRSNNAGRAESDASLEWAALTGPGGRGAYDGVAGNKGSISIRDLLPLVRKQVMEGKVGDDLSQDIFDARKKRDEEAQQLEKLRKDGLLTSARQLAILERQADVTRAITSEEKITASSDLARTERMYKFIDLLKEAQGDEQQMNVLRQQQLELDRAQLEYGLQLNDALLRRVGISGELLDQSRFTGTGSGAREQTFDLKGTLADTSPAEEKIDRLEQAAESSSQAIGGLFRDIISGTATAEESLARTFQSIADSFASMVSDMIAEWAKAQIIGLFRNVAGPIAGAVGGGFGATSGDLFGQGLGVQGSLLSFAGGGHTGSSPRSGGVDGQGGFPAILHPQETVIDHTRMMPVPYQTSPAAAATGELAVPYQSSGQALSVPFLKTGGGDGGAASMPLDNEPIRYESRIVDGVETVTKEQAEEIGRRTEQRVLKRLQNSPGARRAVGIG